MNEAVNVAVVYREQYNVDKYSTTALCLALGDVYDAELVAVGYDFEEKRFLSLSERGTILLLMAVPGSVKQLKKLGSDGASVVSRIVKGTGKFIKPNLVMDSAQFGKKVGKHAQDFGLNPALQSSRDFVRNHIDDIYNNAEEIRSGMWRGLGEVMGNGNRADGMANFLRKGNDVVVTDTAGNFVTILKDGATQNTRFKGAEIIFGGN